jgi:hypothetical protein
MLNRIAQVLVTYLTRPAFWVLGTLYVIGAVALANSGFTRVGPQQSVAAALPQSMQTLNLTDVESIQRFEAGTFDRSVRAATIFWHNESAEGSKPVRVWPDGRLEEITYPPFSAKHLRQLKECRRLRTLALQFRGYLTEDEWQALGELDQITALKYDGVVSPFGMRQIARLRKLQFLDLSGCTFDAGLEDLESLASLQTVVLDNFVENRVHVLGQLRRLPHLRTLVATHYREAGSIIPRAIWISNLDDLRAATGLERWFVDEQARGFPGFDALARELPGIAVRPVQIDIVRQMACIMVGMLTGILVFLLALQLNSQFAHPAARLTPGYAVPHLIPATVLWLCSVLVPACLLASAKIPLLPLVAVSTAIWLVIGSPFLNFDPLARTQRASPRWRRRIIFSIQIMGVLGLFLMLLVMVRNPSGIDWFLRGHQPGLAIVMIIGGVLGYVLFVRKSYGAQVEFQEAGMGTPALGFILSQRSARQAQVVRRQQQGGGAIPLFWIRLDRQLARAIDQAGQPGWRRRSNLWIAGNAFDGKLALACCLVFFVMTGSGSLVAALGRGMDFEFADFDTNPQGPPFAMAPLMFPDFCFACLGLVWRGRRHLLAIESLRPVSRRQLVRELMTALAWDCAPMVWLYVAVVAALTCLADAQTWTPLWTVALAVYLAAHTALACAVISWLNTIRRDWVAGLAGFVIGCVFLCAGVGSAMLFMPALGINRLPPDLPNLSHWRLLGLGLAWGAVAVATFAYAFRRWMNVELGDYAA